jgi:hypothetical protein
MKKGKSHDFHISLTLNLNLYEKNVHKYIENVDIGVLIFHIIYV